MIEKCVNINRTNKEQRTMSRKTFIYRWILLLVCSSAVVLSLTGCNGESEDGSEESVPGTRQVNTFRITNGSSQTIKKLTIYYDGSSVEIEDLKYGVPVLQQITANYPPTLRFVILYANGQKSEVAREDWYVDANQEIQMVIEDGGKVFFR